MHAALRDFADHTRHTDAERENTNMMARKWVIVHVTDSADAFRRVSNDYDWVNARTHSPALSAYSSERLPAPEALMSVARDGWPLNEPIDTAAPETPVFGAFCDALFPDPIDQEAWEPYKRSDHWMKRAYFLAAQRLNHPHTRALVDAITARSLEGTDATPFDVIQKSERVWDKIADYQRDLGYPRPSASEWGSFVSTLSELSAHTAGDSVEEATPANVESGGANSKCVERFDPVEAAAARHDIGERSTEAQQRNWDEWAINERVQDFRRSAAISPTMSGRALCERYVMAVLGAPAQAEDSGALDSDQREQDLSLVCDILADRVTRDHVAGLDYTTRDLHEAYEAVSAERDDSAVPCDLFVRKAAERGVRMMPVLAAVIVQ